MSEWREEAVEIRPIGALGWVLVICRAVPLFLLVYLCLLALMLLRLVEAPLFGQARPWTPKITRFVCRNALWLIGIGYETRGRPMREKGAVVANHATWLDIFTLNAGQEIYFVSKDEVAKWPGIGILARATGTVFITRKGGEAKRQQDVFEERLRAGHKLLFFPEGTSSDSIRILPFKSSLFQAFFSEGLVDFLHIQPVTVVYHAPHGQDARFYGWWGDMEFASSLLKMLAAARHGRVEVIYHSPVAVHGFAGRKELTLYCERVIREAHEKSLRAG